MSNIGLCRLCLRAVPKRCTPTLAALPAPAAMPAKTAKLHASFGGGVGGIEVALRAWVQGGAAIQPGIEIVFQSKHPKPKLPFFLAQAMMSWRSPLSSQYSRQPLGIKVQSCPVLR